MNNYVSHLINVFWILYVEKYTWSVTILTLAEENNFNYRNILRIRVLVAPLCYLYKNVCGFLKYMKWNIKLQEVKTSNNMN